MKIRIKPIASTSTTVPIVTHDPDNPDKKQVKLKIKRADNNSSKIVLRKSFIGGYGYDSEASDREDDPTIEHHMIMRFKTGSEADYVRSQIDAKNLLSEVCVKFKDSRNAVVTIRKKLFAAKLVDLPTITEVHKSFDKKNIFKVADVCQMLLVGDRILNEDTVLALPTNPKEYVYAHGLTPPLRNVRTRRFRKRASAKTIESVEKEVDRLFNLDARSERTTYTIMDKEDLDSTHNGTEGSDDEMGELSDYEDLAADLEAQLDSPNRSSSVIPESRKVSISVPEPLDPAQPSEDSSDGSEIDSDDVDGEDRDQTMKKSGRKALRESVTQLQSVIAAKKADIERAINPIMKQRLVATLRKCEAELAMKLDEIGEEEQG